MSQRVLWVVCVPLTLLLGIAIAYFTGLYRPEPLAILLFLALVALAVTTGSAPLVSWIAGRLGRESYHRRPSLALRVGLWIGIWASACVGLQMFGLFNAALALAAAVILVMVEVFLQQMSRQRRAR